MTHRPGLRQRAILRAMQQGARLYRRDDGKWFSRDHLVIWHTAATCEGLRDHGYIYADQEDASGFRFALTEQGKAALE